MEGSLPTKDRDNDISGSVNCAVHHKGAWWFHKCYTKGSHLNGLYLSGPSDPHEQGIQWYSWKRNTSLKYTRMKGPPQVKDKIRYVLIVWYY